MGHKEEPLFYMHFKILKINYIIYNKYMGMYVHTYRTILTHEQTGQCVNTNVSCLFLAHLHRTVHAEKLVLYMHACTHTHARTLTHS